MLEAADYPASGSHSRHFDGRRYALGGVSQTNLGRCQDANNPGSALAKVNPPLVMAVGLGIAALSQYQDASGFVVAVWVLALVITGAGIGLAWPHLSAWAMGSSVDPAEGRPALRGDVRLYDCETGEEREVTVTESLLSRMHRAYDDYLKQIDHFCSGHQVPYLAADVNVRFDELVLGVFRRGGFLR